MPNTQPLSDTELLDLMQRGLLVVQENRDVWKWHDGWGRYQKLAENPHPKSGRVRFNIRLGHRQRTVYRNKLFWLWKHRHLPGDLHIDHIDHDNRNDHPENLRLRCPHENSSDNWSSRTDEENRVEAARHGSLGDF